MLLKLIVRLTTKQHRHSARPALGGAPTRRRHSEPACAGRRSEESRFDFYAGSTLATSSFSVSPTNSKTCHPERNSPAFASHFAPAKWLGWVVEGSERDFQTGRI